MHFPLSVMIIFGHFPLFLMKNTVENHDVFNDGTPSPEWIKYQQERNDPKYNKQPPVATIPAGTSKDHQLSNKASSGHHKEFKANAQNRFDAVPRQNSVANEKQANEHDDDEELYVDVEDDENHDDKEQYSAKGDANVDNTSSLKYPSIPGFIAFLKSLKKTWANKSLFRIDDKIEFLYNLKDSLMRAIEQHFSTLWPEDADDNESKDVANSGTEDLHSRSKRGILDASNIEFPPEAALISINFLTFAVFLIKLVLQVVNIIKSKHVQLSSLGFNTNGFSTG